MLQDSTWHICCVCKFVLIEHAIGWSKLQEQVEDFESNKHVKHVKNLKHHAAIQRRPSRECQHIYALHAICYNKNTYYNVALTKKKYNK